MSKLLVVGGLLVGGTAPALAGPNDLRTIAPRPTRAVDDARVNERFDDKLGDAIERALEEHAKIRSLPENKGKPASEVIPVIIAADKSRATDLENDTHARSDAHLARVVDRKGDREEWIRYETVAFGARLDAIKKGQFAKDTVQAGPHEDTDLQKQNKNREEQKLQTKDDAKSNRTQDKRQDIQNEREEARRDLIRERTDEAKDRIKEKLDEKKQDQKQDLAERAKERLDDKVKDRQDDRKEARDEARQDKADERTAAKAGVGASGAGP